MRRPALLRLLVLALLVLAGLGLLYWSAQQGGLELATLQRHQATLERWIGAHPLQAAGLYLAAYVLVCALSLPGAAVMTLAGGALFGLGRGTLLASLASTLGALAAFLLARWLFAAAVRRRFAPRLAAVDRGVARDGAFYLASLRLVPVVPFVLVNLLMALTPIRAWTYTWVSLLAMFPATLAYVNAGTALARIDSPGDVLSPRLLGALLLLALLPWLLRGLLGWLQRRRALRGFRRPRRFDVDLLVIGGGAAGLVAAQTGVALAAKVALVERARMGGECLNTGCVPSKALLRSARAAAEARAAMQHGVRVDGVAVDFEAVMHRVRAAIAQIAPHDSMERYRALGVDCIAGSARLLSPWQAEVGDRRITARGIVLATGGRPRLPDLPGIGDVAYLTSESVWSLPALPRRLLVLGGGPVGCELAQAFARLGAQVTLVQRGPRLLPRDDAESAALVEAALRRDGVAVCTGHAAEGVEGRGQAGTLQCRHAGREVALAFDALLLAVGREPATDGLGLDAVGVALGPGGTIAVDARQRSRVPTIHACGDVASALRFTHLAADQAWRAAANALLAPWWSLRGGAPVLPWCTFTDPEVAQVGLDEATARARGVPFELTRVALAQLDRAVAEGDTTGFAKVLTVPGRDRILGASLCGPQAGEQVASFTLAMRHRLGLRKLLATIHAYPTHMEVAKLVAGAWQRAHAPRRLLATAAAVHRWRRG
jgi:pyruvate/2-oxoglutarate dehydrogenase complex dihydrolipoamide dehydrogenase (E3) component/uncharacterized membrane protein YdjX (TVP38/TMEM64 family)